MKHVNKKDILLKEGIFAKQFPTDEQEIISNSSDISKYKDLVDVSNNYNNQFYNSGVMINGEIYSAKLDPKCDDIYPLKKIRETKEIDEKYFLSDERIKKFRILKGSKRIPRKKPNGEDYIYSEGAMPFPDNLEAPARTMLTSESGTSRMTHVIEDYKTKRLRLLTPLECERINGFPDNWTDTGMTDKKRYFMMGNALVVDVVGRIGIELEKIIEHEN